MSFLKNIFENRKDAKKTIENTQDDWKKEFFVYHPIHGDKEKAHIQDVTRILTDPEYLQTFNITADMHYAMLNEGLFSDSQQTEHEMAFLHDFIIREERPLYALLRFSNTLRTSVGQRAESYFSAPLSPEFKQEEKKKLQTIYSGLHEIIDDAHTPYLLAQSLDPSLIMKPYAPFEKWKESVTPVFITDEYAIVDTGEQLFNILRIPQNKKDEVLSLIERYQKDMEAMQTPAPPIPKNASRKELWEYKKKYLNTKIHADMRWGLPVEMEEYVIPLQEWNTLFPHLSNGFEALTDETVFEARSFFKKGIRDNIEKDLHINLQKLSFQEQIYFLTFIARRKNSEFSELRDFTHRYGNDGLHTFLSLAKGGPEMGQKILDIGEKLPEESARAIFAKYTELVYASEASIKNISQYRVDVEAIRDYLLDRGVRWLKSFDYHTITEKQLIRKLENSKQEIFIKGQVLKYLNKHLENFDIEAFSRDFAIEMKKSTELSEKEKEEHIELYDVLRDHYDSHTKESTVSYYKKKLEEEDQVILDIRDNKENALIGSIRVGKMNNGNYEIASLMVDYPYEHIDLGSLIFEKAVALFGDKTLEGRVLKGKEWLLDYYARFDFKVAEEINDDGVPAYRIIREPNPIEH